MAKKGILVTGGTGLVGAYAVGMLLQRGERPVVFDIALNERLLNAVFLVDEHHHPAGFDLGNSR